MIGTYTAPAIPPHCKVITVRVEVVKWLGDRVLLRELDRPRFLIDADLGSFEADPATDTAPKLPRLWVIPDNEPDYGGAFDGHGVVSDADPGL